MFRSMRMHLLSIFFCIKIPVWRSQEKIAVSLNIDVPDLFSFVAVVIDMAP